MSVGKDVDLELCMSPASFHVLGAPTSPKPSRKYAIAVQNLKGSSILVDVECQDEVDGHLRFNTAKKQICRTLVHGWYQRLSEKLFISLMVGTAKVQQVLRYGSTQSASGSPALTAFSPVYFTDFRRSLLLTEALRNPLLQFHDPDHWLGKPLDTASSKLDAALVGKRIVVVRKVIDKTKVACLLVLLLGVSPILGVVVGLCSHNAEAGIAVSAGMFALASFTQGVVAWIQG